MITFDGHRSMLRKPFAAKKLAMLHELDLPAQTLLWNGFRIKVWQQGEIDGGRVTAPMGAIVCFGANDGDYGKQQVAIAEYFRGAFTSVKDLYSVYFPVDGNAARIKRFDYPDEEVFFDDGNSIIKYVTMGVNAPFGTVDGTGVGSTEWHREFCGVPGTMPDRYNERFWLTMSNNIFVDLNDNGAADFPKYIVDRSRLFYLGDGSYTNKRGTVSLQVGGGEEMASADQPWRVIQQLNAEWQTIHHLPGYQVSSGRKVCVWNIGYPGRAFHAIYLDQMVPMDTPGFPEALWHIMLMTTGINSVWNFGNYSFGTPVEVEGEPTVIQTLLHGVNLTNTFPWTASSPTQAYFESNQSEKYWMIFYSFYSGGVVNVISSSQFISLLDDLADIEIVHSSGAVNWNNARRMFHQLFGWPNHNFNVPYDSIMIHAQDGNIYTWTRKYGVVKFTPTGLFKVDPEDFVVPDEVIDEDGMRPEITHAGGGLYLCVCNKLKDRVAAVYFGSPFGSWVKLPDGPPPVLAGRPDPTLVQVRPVRVTLEDIFLIGVLKDTVLEDDIDVERYFFASLRWRVVDGEPTVDTWTRHGRLPFDVAENDNLSVGLYGNDPFVKDLASYHSPPPVLPQMPVGPYHLYAIGLP